MALGDKLSWLKFSSEPTLPRSAVGQLVHFVLSLLLVGLALGFAYMVVTSETRRTFECDAQVCFVKERNGLFASPIKLIKADKPVSIEVRDRQPGRRAVLLVDAAGESDWVTNANESPARINAIAKDLASYSEGDVYVVARGGFGLEWYFLGVMLLVSCLLNLRNSLRGFQREETV